PTDRPSLTDVTGALVAVLNGSGVSARQARQRLIARTAPHADGRLVPPPGPIAEYVPTVDDPVVPPTERQDTGHADVPAKADVHVPPPPAPRPVVSRPRTPRGRTPDAATAHDVAEALRSAYAKEAAFVPARGGGR
ncbi:hypothetical protein NGM37_48020, partial [Streptomyces sp. TRM76130]|nr:hypothetical protein [Streptomyces sp. TRM76130]